MSGLHDWFQTPPGQVALAWERQQLDAALADVFGYHALQLGLAELDALAANRMPHRWLARLGPPVPDLDVPRTALVTESTALPFPEASLDLVVLAHTLEFSADPHACLREVQRVLVHEGRVAITGFNPVSLWGGRQRRAHWLRRLGGTRLYLPDVGEFITPWRLRDWLRLLEFELESSSYGCYQPAVRGARALARFGWMERLGRRWWPILGATYCLVAVKRARGMRLIGASWKKPAATVSVPASLASRAVPTPTSTERHLEPR
ncbi:MAG TPA: methyltransferase domain-containing protein [Ottowia sp.]|uniref:class I SAM-dependent methyltransferase n=1 Tax=Ottowia sp. TaxID=1898956 RepID=UPI002C81462E|nr:methyltransferase domain-containing protein [Ottowia sp.]HMN21857.1 methyltransferase domain-containing protein [Ottowia sp.]